MTEEESFDKLTPKLDELVSEISIYKFISSNGDAYKKIKFPVSNKSNFSEIGMNIVRKDYYAHLKNYCLDIR